MKNNLIILACVDYGSPNAIGIRLTESLPLLAETFRVFLICRSASIIPSNLLFIPLYPVRILSLFCQTLRFTLFPSLDIRPIELSFFSLLAIIIIPFHALFSLRTPKTAYIWDPEPFLIAVLRFFRYKIVLDLCMTPSLASLHQTQKHPDFYYDTSTTLDSALLQINNISKLDVVISPSTYTSQFLKDYLPASQASICTVPFGVNHSAFSDIPAVNLQNRTLVLGFVGLINMRKGIHHLIHALNLISEDRTDFALELYGRVHPLTRPILSSANFPVKLNPFTRDKYLIYSNFDVLIHPSFIEGSAKCIYEALASAKPVICTHQSGPVLPQSDSILVYPAGETDSLIKCILYFLDSPSLVESASLQNRELIKPFTWQRYSSTVASVLQAR